jgi:ATP-binding cassette subfamily B multidrug efflux pump
VELYDASFGAQFISGLIMPAMTFIGNLVYVGIAVVGGLQVASGAMQLGDVQAFIQYSRQFTMPLAQLGSMANLLQSGVASAERVFELLDTDEQSLDPSPSEAPNGGRARPPEFRPPKPLAGRTQCCPGLIRRTATYPAAPCPSASAARCASSR